MCLITSQTKPLIASEDITCYKYMFRDNSTDNQYVSCYDHNFNGSNISWEIGKVRSAEIKQNYEFTYQDNITKSFYSESLSHMDHNLVSFGEGLHASLTFDRITPVKCLSGYSYTYLSNDLVYTEMLIPKGSEYFLDETGLIVANQMILVKEIKKR